MNFDNFFSTISEEAQNKVGKSHDTARGSFLLASTTVPDWPSFEDVLLDYYCHHCRVVGGGDQGDPAKNLGAAKEYAVRGAGYNATIEQLYRNANEGANRGLVGVLDGMANAIKQKQIEYYLSSAFGAYVDPTSISETTEIMRQFFRKCGAFLPSRIDVNRPEYYAKNFRSYITVFSQAMASMAADTRKL